jgi:polysaccharide pyruvyl transferase WcaK-like protein
MRDRPLRVAFWGNFGTGNWGNECTLQAIVHNTRRLLPDAELSCFCYRPEDTRWRHGLPSFPINDRRLRADGGSVEPSPEGLKQLLRVSNELGSFRDAVDLVRRADLVLMAGTGMLTDSGEGPMGMPFDMFRWSLAARACGSRVGFASVGVEPIEHPVAKFFITTSLRLAAYRSYRDERSRRRLEEVGFPAASDPVLPDLAFSLPESMGVERRSAARLRTIRPAVGVGLYDYKGRGLSSAGDYAAYRAYLEKIAAFVLRLLDRGHPVRILIGDVTYDVPVLEDLRAMLASRGIARYAGSFEDAPARSVDEVLDQLAELDVVIASRFHNVLLSLFLGKPVISISYNEKNDALMGGMGLAEYCRSIGDFELPWLESALDRAMSDAPSIEARVGEMAAVYRAALDEQYGVLFKDELARRVPPAAPRRSRRYLVA